MKKEFKKSILVVSSGTVDENARKQNIEAVEKEIEKNFSDYEIRRAFSSEKIVNKLALTYGVYINRPEEALIKLKEEGFSQVILQPLHLIAGDEYEDIQRVAEKFKDDFDTITLGKPLLYTLCDCEKVLEASKSQLPMLNKDMAVVLIGHGSDHIADESYSTFQRLIDKQNLNIFVGTIKGKLTASSIIDRLKRNNIKQVLLMPLMLVAGAHAVKDIASCEKNSWKSILEKEGFSVEMYLHGLGENKEIQKLYVEKLKTEIRRL